MSLLLSVACACSRGEPAQADGQREPSSSARSPAANDEPQGSAACSNAPGACKNDAYCAFEPELCGKGKTPGTCKPRPSSCPDVYEPVCGCDHEIYPNECAAHAAGIDLDVNGGCKKLPDFMACGRSYCDARVSYCEIVLSDVFELPTDSTCKPLPESCRPRGNVAAPCDCFPRGTRCASFCGPIETGGALSGLHLTCRL